MSFRTPESIFTDQVSKKETKIYKNVRAPPELKTSEIALSILDFASTLLSQVCVDTDFESIEPQNRTFD